MLQFFKDNIEPSNEALASALGIKRIVVKGDSNIYLFEKIGEKIEYHSRFDQHHIAKCDSCHDQYNDFLGSEDWDDRGDCGEI